MSALDQEYKPSYWEVLVAGAAELKAQTKVCLHKNELSAIGDLRDERESVVHLIIRVCEPVCIPARTQMGVKICFKPPVYENTLVLVEPKEVLLETHGVCLAKGHIYHSNGELKMNS